MYQTEKNIFNILRQATEFLKSNNIKEAQLDAEILLCGILEVSRSKLYILRRESITEEQYKKYKEYLNRRITREPVDYILGNSEFMGLNFNVNSNVLIPRQETELIVEHANKFIKETKAKNILDLCTGSGCVAVSLAYYNDNVSVVASDVSEAALEVAKSNALINNVSEKIKFIKSDMFNNIIDEKFDIIISNPPYVKNDEYKGLEKEIFFEPKIAFLADDDGLTFYRIIAQKAKQYLNKKGMLLLELNSNISSKVADLFNDFNSVSIVKDYSGLDRILIAQNG
jgi:release factor glutamine methyltransferase